MVMNKDRLIELRGQYKKMFLEDVTPFWSKYSIDWQHKGFLNYLDQEGSVYCTDKSV